MNTFTEVDFYKAIQNLLYQTIDITKRQKPVEQEDGTIAYPEDDGQLKIVEDDIRSLWRSLAILKQAYS